MLAQGESAALCEFRLAGPQLLASVGSSLVHFRSVPSCASLPIQESRAAGLLWGAPDALQGPCYEVLSWEDVPIQQARQQPGKSSCVQMLCVRFLFFQSGLCRVCMPWAGRGTAPILR